MTERTSHLMGTSIGDAISNTSQTKPVLPMSQEHGSQVKDQGRWQCCHNEHKKFSYRPTYLYFLEKPHIITAVHALCQ